jgi:predicted ATPase
MTAPREKPGVSSSASSPTPLVRDVVIHGFKSFGERCEIELGRVNVFVGPNGCGKSALLEALGVLSATVGGQVEEMTLRARGVRPGVPALYKSSFKKSPYHRLFITLRAANADCSYEVGLNNPVNKPTPAWEIKTESLRRHGDVVRGYSRSARSRGLPVDRFTSLVSSARGRTDFLESEKRFLGALRNYAIFSPNTSVLRGTDPDLGQRIPVGLNGGRLAEAVQHLIRLYRMNGEHRLLDFISLIDWVEAAGVQAAPPNPSILAPTVPTTGLTLSFVDRFMREGRNHLMAYDASEGALYVLFLAVLALHPDAPWVLAVDNFDHAMNPRLARAVTRLFADCILQSSYPRQVLLTTHNPLVLDGLDLSNDEVRLFTLDRDSRGMTTVRRITVNAPLSDVESGKGPSLSRLWVMGRLGGMPNV